MQLILSKDAEKQYNKLPKPVQTKIKRKLLSLTENPLEGKKLEGKLSESRSIRAWPYRIIYIINTKQKRIEVSAILHRQSAYKQV